MRLPPSLLDHVRLGLGVSALFVPGCDAASRLIDAENGEIVQSVEEASSPDAEAAQPSSTAPEGASTPTPGLGAQIAKAIASAEPLPAPSVDAGPAPRTRPLGGATGETPVSEDVTAFVPFSETSGGTPVAPFATAKPAPRPRVPRVRPKIDEVEPCESPKLIKGSGGGWDCPACGRG